MNRVRVNSSPDLGPSSSTVKQSYDDSALEGVAAHLKLLLKLIQDHKDACSKEQNDSWRMLRVATMMTILDNVRTRIQKCQSFGNRKSELRRCNTDLRPNCIPKDKRPPEAITDEKERLRKQLSASLAARKSLEIMCSSLGKEKEIMAAELYRKVQELNEMEELVNDLKARNGTLLEKVQSYANRSCVGDYQAQQIVDLEERSKELSDKLLRSLEGYRSVKRKLRGTQEENMVMRAAMDEMGAKVKTSLDRVRSFKERISSSYAESDDIKEEIIVLEDMFESFQHEGKCIDVKGEINACKPSIFA